MLLEKRDGLENLAQALLEKEVLFKDDLIQIIGERPFEEPKVLENGDASDNEKQELADKLPDENPSTLSHPLSETE